MIELKNINIKEGGFYLKNISLKLEAGKFHVLLGPSGSGKTVLLETIAGLIKQEDGSIIFYDKDVSDYPPEKRGISYLPQDNALFPHKNVFENIAFGLKLKRKLTTSDIKDKILQIAKTLNITDLLKRNIKNLSGGEKQRVALARVLVLDNPLLLLDEPTSSLHESMQENFCLMLKDIQKQFKLTILMTTHHKDSAFMLSDTLSFIENGQLALSIASEKLYHTSLPIKIAELVGISNILTLKKTGEPGNYQCAEINSQLKISNIPDLPDKDFLLGIRPVDIRVIKEDEKNLIHDNCFSVVVDEIYLKENNALVLLKIPQTGFVLKMELSIYNLNKMDIYKGKNIYCKIKDGYSRVVY